MRLIDADALIEHAELKEWGLTKNLWINAEVFRNAPTVDAVPVVRCRDCKWWKEETEYEWDGETELKQQLCTEHDGYFEPDDYCSWGERREDEAD